MKKIVLVTMFLLSLISLHAQQATIEAEIRKMEDAERLATLNKNAAALEKIWSTTFLVNAPAGRVVQATGNVADRPVMSISYSSFAREVEHIQIKNDVVFSMGNETVVMGANMPNANQTIKRRYTNIWMKEDGGWRLVARHASVICQQ
jgi:ketosteroid isomerase-like protein